ncbi:MBL fold metallo-hydrolase [Oscillibacter sp. GMB15532]|uniref:MBL fold metallo-hydrolase n=1 Tax=Oscillibacter sp. GMB15532 TaxID=3230022 RepID=UPI0034DE1F39
MPLRQITFSANAGVALRLGGIRLWVDAVHEEPVSGFSVLSPALQSAVTAHPDFQQPNLIFCTHCHPDHFSRRLLAQAMKRWPLAEVILPERQFERQILLSQPHERLVLPELSIRFVRLPHEGKEYAAVAHYGCLLDHDGFRILIAGDCAVASPVLREFLLETGPVDLALLNFPWITLSKGRKFIEQFIRPRHLAVYHLPFEQDDIYTYRRAAIRAAEQVLAEDVRLFLNPLQQERF